jgi:hypothetical protein
MKITLDQAFKILNECSALSTDNGELFYPSLCDELEGSDENEFAYFQYEDDEGLIYSVKFNEGENQEAYIHRNIMTLIDSEGYEFSFYVLGPFDTEKFLETI